ncbi:MAG: hypothetical protein IKK10_04700 [Clostridia bacterium]|nr:hypothetical protein [Clostridia bacterium]
MKYKGILSIILVLCMLLSVQSISVFAGDTDDTEDAENFVTLFAAFNNFEGKEMTTEDNKNFFLSTKLDAGSYQFEVEENGTLLSHPTTVKDTTSRIGDNGILLSENVDARCTLLASGGEYTFEYNTDSDLLKIKKAGTGNPDNSGEALTVIANNQEITATMGDKFTYNVYLKADEAFEDIQVVLNFDESKLSLTDTTEKICCPTLSEVSFNTNINSLVALNSCNLEGYDFKNEKLLLTFEFTAVGTGKAYLDLTVQDMTVLGGEKSYFFLSKETTEGAVLREELIPDIPVAPTTTATEPATTLTIPTETSPSTTSSETPAETVPSTTVSSYDEVTTAPTDPSETVTTSPSSEYELGDVNRDGKLNIRDATLIQKALAKLEQLDGEQMLLADYLTDSKVNIKDATQIQKKLANLI